jgi:hypothetical protein
MFVQALQENCILVAVKNNHKVKKTAYLAAAMIGHKIRRC